MAKWEFNKADPSEVEQGVTQADSFNNDDIDLSEALIRETIQNSLDAGKESNTVRISFRFVTISGEKLEGLKSILNPLKPHLQACDIDISPLSEPECRLLIIEDYNTTGLTGKTDALDGGHFHNFWRRAGVSSKGGKTGGRWGLGKIVYPISSRLRVWFGLTIRCNDKTPVLMGQAVLKNHTVKNEKHKGHGFWFSKMTDIQIPITDKEEISRFCNITEVERRDESGLSIVVPYLKSEAKKDANIEAFVLKNYYLQILQEKLEVEIDDNLINREKFEEVIKKSNSRKFNLPLDFIEQVCANIGNHADIKANKPIGKQRLKGGLENLFIDSDVDKLKEVYKAGSLVHVMIPVSLEHKKHGRKKGSIDIFLKQLPKNGSSYSLYARGPIVLTEESKNFNHAKAYGALIANDVVSDFLGDAENPAHTSWNSNAEKLHSNWVTPKFIIQNIRQSLYLLYQLISDIPEVQKEGLLSKFFPVPGGDKPAIPPPEPDIIVNPVEGGFTLTPVDQNKEWKKIEVQMAYNMVGGKSFEAHSEFDFDLSDPDKCIIVDGRIGVPRSPEDEGCIRIEKMKAEIEIESKNKLMLTADPGFWVKVSGFDQRRDVTVDANEK